jgi:hypothetical protein
LTRLDPKETIATDSFAPSDTGTGNLVLNLEDVIELPIVGFRPEVVSVIHSNELYSNAELVAGLTLTARSIATRIRLL